MVKGTPEDREGYPSGSSIGAAVFYKRSIYLKHTSRSLSGNSENS